MLPDESRFPMMIRLFAALAVSLGLGGAAMAEAPAQADYVQAGISEPIAKLSDTMMMGDLMEVIRQEGQDYGTTLEAEMFPGRGGGDWRGIVGLIYDPARMREKFDQELAAELGPDAKAVAAAQKFFETPLGQKILSLEVEARRALMDDATEEAAQVTIDQMVAEHDPRMEALRHYAETNDLIEMNVVGALNANLAFYKGLSEGGAFEDAMPEDQMLSEVWSQEPDIRAETETWLFSYLALAYQPLSDEELAAYQTFSDTAEGQKLNRSLSVAFDKVFTEISHNLGLAAAKQMQGEDI